MCRPASGEMNGGDRVLALADGRSLRYREFGDRAGRPVLALHGTPGSRLKFAGLDEAAASYCLRLICPDRWGYGGSDAPVQPELMHYAADIRELMDALGIGRFGVLGVSGGGPFGSVVAVLLGKRIIRLALVCPVGPMAGQNYSGVSMFHRLCFNGLPHVPGATRAIFTLFAGLLRLAPRAAVRLSVARAAKDDRRLMRDAGHSSAVAQSYIDGMARGCDGPVVDMALFARDWGLSMSTKIPVRIWIGAEDRNVPRPAVEHLAELMSAELTVMPAKGHYWLAEVNGDGMQWLAAE